MVGSEMAKYKLRLKARELRKKGNSVNEIARELQVSKSSVSWWVRDIVLTEIQIALLKEKESKGKELGRFKTMQIMREKRAKYIEEFDKAGSRRLSTLTKNEFFILGLSLYWAEGGKTIRNKRVEFCNSDPRMIKFLLLWLVTAFEVPKEDLRCVVGINQIHASREEIVKKYWSEVTEIPLDQFRKTSLKKVTSTKVYDNFDSHYGTLSVLVAKSTSLYFEIMGLIRALMQAKILAA